jgi:stage II sporulation protein R
MIPALVICVVIGMIPFFASCEELYDDVLRVHIKANSDTAADQSLKLAVRDRVVTEFSACYDGCSGKEDAIRITREHLKEIEDAAREEIKERGFDYEVSAQVGEAYFHTREYDDFTMPAGWYDALRLTIGAGEGENWWCVMYPALCVGAACRDEMREKLREGEYRVVTADKVDFRFKAVEYWEDFLNWFR